MAERFTEKNLVNGWDNKYFVKPSLFSERGFKAIDKLGELEDIEEELGIGLITFAKLTKAKEIYDIEEDSTTTFTYIDFENHLIVCVDEFDEMSGRNNEWSYRFEDYGKTWALTKEELEKGKNNEQHN